MRKELAQDSREEFLFGKVTTSYIREEEEFESTIREGRSDLRSSGIPEKQYGTSHHILGRQEKMIDALRRCSQDVIFDQISVEIPDPKKQTEIKVTCLQTVKKWWNGQLDSDDRAYDTLEIGRRRIGEINEQIKNLQDPNHFGKDKKSKNNFWKSLSVIRAMRKSKTAIPTS